MLRSLVVKVNHKFIRSPLEPVAKAMCTSTQLGGTKGKGGDIAAMYTTIFNEWARHKGWSSFVAYTDLEGAFHSALHQHLFDTNITPEDRQELLSGVDNPE